MNRDGSKHRDLEWDSDRERSRSRGRDPADNKYYAPPWAKRAADIPPKYRYDGPEKELYFSDEPPQKVRHGDEHVYRDAQLDNLKKQTFDWKAYERTSTDNARAAQDRKENNVDTIDWAEMDQMKKDAERRERRRREEEADEASRRDDEERMERRRVKKDEKMRREKESKRKIGVEIGDHIGTMVDEAVFPSADCWPAAQL